MKKSMLLILSFLFLSACSGASLIQPDASLNEGNAGSLLVMGIHHDDEGNAILANALGEKEFMTDLGYHVHLQEAFVNWHELQLISSGENPECRGENDTGISLNQVEDLLGEDLVTSLLATALVPTVAFCEYEIILGPSSVSALKFHEGEDHPEDGGSQGIEVTYHLMGRWEKDAASGVFNLMTTEEISSHGHFQVEEGGVRIDHPLHFHEGETQKNLILGIKYNTLLDGIDFMADSEAGQIGRVLENLPKTVHLHLGETHEAALSDGVHIH